MQTSMLLYKVWRMWFFILFIFSMYPWFSWNINSVVISIITVLLSALFLNKKNYIGKPYTLSLILFFIFFLWQARRLNLFGIIESICLFFSIAVLFCLREEYKYDLIRFITKWFSIIVGVSLFFYILYLLGFPLPYTYSQMGDSSNYEFDNYFFFLAKDISMRFRGPFLEPGHMTMGIAPILFINKYDFKNPYVVVLSLAQLFSMSLAGIILFFLGYILIALSRNKGVKQKILSITPLFLIVLIAGALIWYAYGRDSVEEMFLARLVYDSDLGTIAGYNRTTEYFDHLYNQVMSSSHRWVGVELTDQDFEGGVAGYKRFFVENGLISAFLIIVAYFSVAFKSGNRNKKLASMLLLVLILLLSQNAYPLWWCMLISLACGVPYMVSNERKYRI